MTRTGRPPSISREKIAAIADALAAGATDEAAAVQGGISHSTFKLWTREAQSGRGGLYADFLSETTHARQKGEAFLAAEIRSQASSDWRAASWLLTHHPRYRDRWSDAAAERKAETAILAEVVKVIEAEFSSEPDLRHRLFTALAASGLSRQGGNDDATE